jgi:hypothetical protein
MVITHRSTAPQQPKAAFVSTFISIDMKYHVINKLLIEELAKKLPEILVI